jgi:hypothetical protein
MDFYSLCAKYWGIDRLSAKLKVLTCYLYAGADPDSVNQCINAGYPSFERVAQLQPCVLQYIPTEARHELLAHHGIVVGVN